MAQQVDLGPEVRAMSKEWRFAFFVSHQEKKREIVMPSVWKIYGPLLMSEGSFIEARGLPTEFFSDWNDRIIDLKIEAVEEFRLKDRLVLLFFHGCAMGFFKSGRWFALRTTEQGNVARSFDVVPISPDLAGRIACFPTDWQGKVEFLNELPEGKRLQSKTSADLAVKCRTEIKPISEAEAARPPQLPEGGDERTEKD